MDKHKEIKTSVPPVYNLPHIEADILRQIIDKLEEMRSESELIINVHLQHDFKPDVVSKEVGDDIDHASEERDREMNLIMHQRHLRRLQQIEEAFERMADGSYGLCESTDEPINPRRLLLMPLTRYSLEYQQEQERLMGRSYDDEMLEGVQALDKEDN